MAKESSLMWPMLIIVAGAGIGGYIWMQRDKTPVGLVVIKQYDEGHMGYDEDENEYSYTIVEGTWRESDNSLTIESESADRPLRIVFKNNEPIDGEIITISEWGEPDGRDYEDNEEGQKQRMDDYNARIDKAIAWMDGYGIDTSSLEGEKVGESTSKEQSQEAESIYGPMLSLQSHFVW